MTTQATRRRVMRARRESVCPICQLPIRPGDHIIRLGMWMHIAHVLDRLAATYTQTRTEESQP